MKYINYIIETIKYYITCIWLHSPIYYNVTLKAYLLKELIANCDNKQRAIIISNRKAFKWVSKSYKVKLINKYINEKLN